MRILLIRFEQYPLGNASSFRAYILSKLVASCGFDIDIVTPKYVPSLYNLQGINVISTSEYGEQIEEIVKNLIKKERYDCIIRPASIKHYIRLDKLFREYDIPVILDAVEWYNSTNWRLGYFDVRYYYFQLLWRLAFGKKEAIIAISRLIENYYKDKRCLTVRIPTITDCSNTGYRIDVNPNEKIRFVFCGMLDRYKDNIDMFIEEMIRIDPNGEKLQLDIYGPETRELLNHIKKNEDYLHSHKNIIVHGRVPQDEAQLACYNADYSVFFRLNRRSANAGFPTKLGECMTFGTPAICNDTGDISLVVENEKNGFLLSEYSGKEIQKVLKKVCEMSAEERVQMRKEARIKAEQFFDFNRHKDTIAKLIDLACNKTGDKTK